MAAAARGEPGGAARSAEVDAFLATLPGDLRSALERLRGQIAAAAPEAVETIAYSVPAFKYRGRPLVSFSAGRTGQGPCSFYVQSPSVMAAHRDELRAFETTKGTIHFPPGEPLSAELVTKIVQARMAETDDARKR